MFLRSGKFVFTAVVLLAVLGFCSEIKAQTTWTGAVSTDWFTAGNWSPAVVPNSSTTDVIVPNTTNKPLVTATAVTMRNLTINAGASVTVQTVTAQNYFYVYGTVSISGTLAFTGTGTYYTYAQIFGDSVTVNAGGSITTSAKTYAMYIQHYGNATTKLPVFTNNGTCSFGNASYYTYYEFYGDFINNGTVTTLNAYFRMYWSVSYGKQNAVIGGTTPITVSYFNLYKYQSAAVWGSVTMNQSLTTTVASTQSTYIVGGDLTISAGVTLTTYGFQKAATSGSTLTMSSATATLTCQAYFYASNGLQENITDGTINLLGTTGISYCYLQSTTFNPAGGTFQVLGTTVNIYNYAVTYPNVSLNNLTVGNGTSGTNCVVSYQSGATTQLFTGTVRVNAASTLTHSGSGATYPIRINGNLINNGTITYTNTLSPFHFGGTTTLSGTGTWNLPSVGILAGGVLTSHSGNINVNGTWSNSGTFGHGSGTVTLTSTTAATITGNSAFNNLTCTQAGKTINFTASSTQTISGVLTLTGATGNRILLRSTSTGVKWNITDSGTENVSFVDVRDSTATNSITANADSLDSGNNTNWVFPDRFTVAATAGTAQQVYANNTGTGGSGLQAGIFTITATAGTPTLATITIMSLGTGNGLTAYSGVALYEDTGGTTGAYDAGVDTIYGTEVSNFGSHPNGTIQFSKNLTYTTSQTRTFFVVVKFNGPTLATPGQTFQYRVETLTSTGAVFAQGVPSTTMNGFTIQAPPMAFADASPGSAATAYPASGDYLLQKFTATYAAGPNNTLTSVTLDSQGSGNDQTAYSSVRLFFDTNSSGSYEPASDTQIATQGAFSADNGTLAFSALAEAFTAGQTKTYFVIVAFNGSVSAGQIFQCQVLSATYGYTGTTTSGAPAPAAFTAGLTIAVPSYTFADASAATASNAYLGGSDYVIQTFTINYPSGPTNQITGLTFTASGTGNDLNDYSSVLLYRDSNANSAYDVGVDTQVSSQTSFAADDGQLTFTLTGSESQFASGSTTRYFVVVAYNLNGTNNTTFSTQLTGASGQLYGATFTGIPAPATGGTAGLILLANNLVCTLNGPSIATSVSNADQGPGGIGLVLCDVTLTTINLGWTVASLTFTASGTGNDALAFNYLALFEDTNTNGTFDGAAGGDTLATASTATAFAINDGDYVVALNNTTFAASSSRRFFLVVKLAGTAISGHTFNASLSNASATPPSGGQLAGIPSAPSAALVIGATALTVTLGPASVGNAAVDGGTAFGYTLAQLRFSASNNSVSVNALTLATQGNGSWVTHLAATNGVELYLDNGNGSYDGTPTDTLLFSAGGNIPSMNCIFSSPVNIANNTSADIWVRINLLANAGGSLPETFRCAIANTSDVTAPGATIVFGNPAPTSGTLSVVVFAVTSFSPSFDAPAGGAAITINGSGFMAPMTVTIGGVLCTGTAVINGTAMQVTGFVVPAGSGSNLPIVINNGALGPKTLTQTFSYSGGSTVGSGAGTGSGGGGGCAADNGGGWGWLAAVALIVTAGALSLRRRRA